jgi:predicted site-specific integrase-resolvase
MKSETNIPGWIGTAADMAAYAGVSKRTIGRWIENGTLKVRHLSKRKMVCRPADLDKALLSVSDRYEMEAAQ